MLHSIKSHGALSFVLILLFICAPTVSNARDGKIKNKIIEKAIKKKMEARKKEEANKGSKEGLYTRGKGKSVRETIEDRSFIAYIPNSYDNRKGLPLLIVKHGGFGSGSQIKNYIGLEPFADQYGFIVAYLDGTQVAGKLPPKFKGWNAGECCGQPQAKKVDDVGFISNVIDTMNNKYGIDKGHVYGTGHSNGAMMTQRVICETNLYKDAITLSGTLQMNVESCPNAKGSRIMNVHGAQDTNLPVEGGHTKSGVNKKTNYKSQEHTKDVFRKSGVEYELLLLDRADHSPSTLNEILIKEHGMTLPEKIVDYLGLDKL